MPGPAPYSARGVALLPAAGARAGLQESHLLPELCPRLQSHSPEGPAGDGKRAAVCPRHPLRTRPGLRRPRVRAQPPVPPGLRARLARRAAPLLTRPGQTSALKRASFPSDGRQYTNEIHLDVFCYQKAALTFK